MPILTHAVPEAEAACLATLLQDSTYLRDAVLEPHHFSHQAYADMFAIMLSLHQLGKQVDMFSVGDRFGDFDTVANVAAMSTGHSPVVYRHYEGLIIESWKRREALRLLGEARMSIDENMDLSALPSMIASLQNLDAYGAEDSETFPNAVDSTLDELANDDGRMKGVSTGLKTLNAALGGLQQGDLIVVGARPSIGKSAFSIHLCLQSAERGVATSLFALEMSKKQNIRRMLSQMALLSGTSMRAPKELFTPEDWQRASYAADKLKQMPIQVIDRTYLTVGDVRSSVRKFATKHPGAKQLAVIDYLGLMPIHERAGGPNASQLYGEIARNFKLMAREYDMPVVLVVQLNRDVTKRKDNRPMLSDIRQSGEVEQHADVVMFLHREGYFDESKKDDLTTEIIVAKQRNGPTGTIKVIFDRERQKFQDMSFRT